MSADAAAGIGILLDHMKLIRGYPMTSDVLSLTGHVKKPCLQMLNIAYISHGESYINSLFDNNINVNIVYKSRIVASGLIYLC